MKRRNLIKLAAAAVGVPLLSKAKAGEAPEGQEFSVGGYRLMFRFTSGGASADHVAGCDGEIEEIAVMTKADRDMGLPADQCRNVLCINGCWPNAEVWIVRPPSGLKTEKPDG